MSALSKHLNEPVETLHNNLTAILQDRSSDLLT